MLSDSQIAIVSFKKSFEKAGSMRRAVGEKKYLKSDLRFYGVPLPVIRQAVIDHCEHHPEMTRDDLLTLVYALWDTDYHELRSVGIGLLERQVPLLTVKDMKVVEDLVRRSQTWAYVDWLATKVAGRLVSEYVSARRILPRWSRDPYMWLRRASILALLPSLKRDGADFPLFSRFAAAMIGEKEFFIRKAVGWVLREVGKTRPDYAYRFLREHIDVVSTLTLREGSKYLPAGKRTALERRFQSRRRPAATMDGARETEAQFRSVRAHGVSRT